MHSKESREQEEDLPETEGGRGMEGLEGERKAPRQLMWADRERSV